MSNDQQKICSLEGQEEASPKEDPRTPRLNTDPSSLAASVLTPSRLNTSEVPSFKAVGPLLARSTDKKKKRHSLIKSPPEKAKIKKGGVLSLSSTRCFLFFGRYSNRALSPKGRKTDARDLPGDERVPDEGSDASPHRHPSSSPLGDVSEASRRGRP
ncbi:hypothetical protein ACLOJK_017700 [Asimina triloba]